MIGTASYSPVSLSWQDNSLNENGFAIERSMNSRTNFVQIGVTQTNITTFTDSPPSTATNYFFYRIRGFNNFGTSSPSNVIGPPATPSNLTANLVPYQNNPVGVAVALTWQDNSNNEVGFTVERSTTGPTSGFTFIPLGTPANSTSTLNVVIWPGTFWYRIRSGNSAGYSSYSNVASITVPIPAPKITISVSPSPVSQTVASGVTQFTFANYTLDATQSFDANHFITLPLALSVNSGNATDLTSCKLYDGVAPVTTGSNVVNPLGSSPTITFTFDGAGFIIPQGTVKWLALKCNVVSGTNGSFQWGYDAVASPVVVGVTTGLPATITEIPSPGQVITVIPSGSYIVIDNLTPGYHIVNAGATNVTLLRLRFVAFTEAIEIGRVGFQLSGTASNTPIDLVNNEVRLYDEANPTVPIATAQFGASDFATSSIIAQGAFTVPANGSKTMIVKGMSLQFHQQVRSSCLAIC